MGNITNFYKKGDCGEWARYIIEKNYLKLKKYFQNNSKVFSPEDVYQTTVCRLLQSELVKDKSEDEIISIILGFTRVGIKYYNIEAKQERRFEFDDSYMTGSDKSEKQEFENEFVNQFTDI